MFLDYITIKKSRQETLWNVKKIVCGRSQIDSFFILWQNRDLKLTMRKETIGEGKKRICGSADFSGGDHWDKWLFQAERGETDQIRHPVF